jgi:hypothetical protein
MSAEVLEIRHNLDGLTTIFAGNPPSRFEEATAAIEGSTTPGNR